jgi:quinol monooxygenase YgiN
MFVVTVEFRPHPDHGAAFREAIVANAQASRALEPGCRQFDVSVDGNGAGTVFLYEIYEDRAAFERHLAMPHFRDFDAHTASWVAQKHVRFYERVDPA